jgi:hypothetical protein
MTTDATAPGSRRGKWVIVPTVVLLALAALWSGVWFYASHVADRTISEWITREAQLGRVYTCGSRNVGGFPFRFELRCAAPTVELRGGSTPVVLKARELMAVAQIYQPDLIIAEATGPMTIAGMGEADSFVVDWSLLQASVRGLPATPERVSVVLDKAQLSRAAPTSEVLTAANRAEFHIRRASAADASGMVFDLASRLSNATLPAVSFFPPGPLNAEFAGVLRGLNDLLPKPLPVRLREWQQAGGRLEVSQLRVQQADAVGVAQGRVALTPEGRLDGGFNLTLAGFEQVTRSLLGGQGQGLQMGLMAGLAMLGGRTELEGKRAVAIPLRLDRGALMIGPLRVGQTAPLY